MSDASLTAYNRAVQKKIQVHRSFKEAEEADAASDAALSPQERLKITIDLHNQRHPDAAQQRLARVARVITLQQSNAEYFDNLSEEAAQEENAIARDLASAAETLDIDREL